MRYFVNVNGEDIPTDKVEFVDISEGPMGEDIMTFIWKGDEYVRLHKALSDFGPLRVWEIMAAGDSLDALKFNVPEEYWDDIETWERHFEKLYANLTIAIHGLHERTKGLSDKELGLLMQSKEGQDKAYYPFVFTLRKHGNLDSARENLYKWFKPKGNVL